MSKADTSAFIAQLRRLRMLGEGRPIADTQQLLDVAWLAQYLAPPDAAVPGVGSGGTAAGALPVQPGPDGQTSPIDGPNPARAKTEGALQETREDQAQPSGEFFAGTGGDGTGARRARSVRVGGAAALPQQSAVARALRPIGLRRPNHFQTLFDEQATIERFSDTSVLVPMFSPRMEPAFDLLLLVEESDALPLWRGRVEAFSRLVARQLGVRSFRVSLLVSRGAAMQARAADGSLHDPARIVSGKLPLTLLLTDGSSGAWTDGRMAGVLRRLGQRTALAVIQLLPEHFWPNTWLGPSETIIGSPHPGTPNAKLQALGRRSLPEHRDSGSDFELVPIASMHPASLRGLANMLVAREGARAGAAIAWLDADVFDADDDDGEEDDRLSPGDRIDRFRSFASPRALQAAVYLSGVSPLTLDVIGVVLAAMDPGSPGEDLPLLLLGGLLQRVHDHPPGTPVGASTPEAGEIRFEFEDGVRELLQRSRLQSDANRIARIVGHFIEVRNAAAQSFQALVEDAVGDIALADPASPFGISGSAESAPASPPETPPLPEAPPPVAPAMSEEQRQLEVRRVLISSTTRDLQQYREVAEAVISEVSASYKGRFVLVPVSMDTSVRDGKPTTPFEVSRAWVRNMCDWVVLIVAWNYGYVPDGEACSVTENEYREASAAGKPCFVFMPGERSDGDVAYRASQNESEDLHQWLSVDSDRSNRQALEAFKAELRKNRLDLFRDLDDFRDRLARTLRQRITEELFQKVAAPDPQLGIEPVLQACLSEVRALAQLLRLRNTLHQIRQFGIRVWREELAVSWPSDGDPSYPARIKYIKGLADIVNWVKRIGTLAAELPESVRKGLPKLNRVVTFAPPEVPECGKAEFTESTDAFAARVQSLFTDCDAQMGESALRLDRLYRTLAYETGQAMTRRQMNPEQDELVRTELTRGMQVHERLQSVLRSHRQWQRAHDEFEAIDAKIQVASERDDDAAGQGRQHAFLDASEDLMDSGLMTIRKLLSDLPEFVNPENQDRADQFNRLGGTVAKYLEALIREPLVDHYEALRKHFDDLFFQIDLETLAMVESAEARARGVEAVLRDIDGATADLT